MHACMHLELDAVDLVDVGLAQVDFSRIEARGEGAPRGCGLPRRLLEDSPQLHDDTRHLDQRAREGEGEGWGCGWG